MKATFENWDIQQFEYPTIGGQVIETSCSMHLLENLGKDSNYSIYVECWPEFIGDKNSITVEVADENEKLDNEVSGFKCINRAKIVSDADKYCYQAVLRKSSNKKPYTEINFIIEDDLFRVGKYYKIALS